MSNEVNEENVDFGDDAPTPDPPLEQKYKEQMRQIVSQKIELPISALKGMIDTQIKLNPDFQRRDLWNVDKQSRFIESIIMNVPIPPVFLGEDEYGDYTVLDGRQRLTAIYDFLRNIYPLKNLQVWSELNGSRYTDLEKKQLDRAVSRRFVPAVVILKESSPEVKYDVFDRLNTGGVVAEPMEIRNAVFQGRFNRKLHDLSQNQTFRRLWDIPVDEEKRKADPIYNRMRDLELVLRFFALREYEAMDVRFKDYLSLYMETRNEIYRADTDKELQDEQLFNRAVNNSFHIFRDAAFRKPLADGRLGSKSAPLADAIMVALSEIETEKILPEKSKQIVAGIAELCLHNPDFQKAIGTGTNGKGAIKTRITLVKEMVRKVCGD
jgi:hypothetical protein